MSRIRTSCTPQEAPYPAKRTAAIDPRWEYASWLLMSSAELRRKLKAERERGVAKHWSYDENHHRLMLAAFKTVQAKEAALRK